MFDTVVIPVLIVSVIGIIAAAILAVVSKFLAVPVDETVKNLRDALPGANCGACGCAGCDEYAEKMAKGEAPCNLCVPGGANAAKACAEILGTEAGEIEEKRAYVKCRGTCDAAKKSMEYEGHMTCKECVTFFGGDKSCEFGCLGMGDCVAACEYDAIRIIDGVAVVNKDNCVGCGACAKACPKGVIELGPLKKDYFVACSSKEMGAYAKQDCANACIGCKKCEKTCPVGAVKVKDFLAHIDQTICINCGKCFRECPTGAILSYKKQPQKQAVTLNVASDADVINNVAE